MAAPVPRAVQALGAARRRPCAFSTRTVRSAPLCRAACL